MVGKPRSYMNLFNCGFLRRLDVRRILKLMLGLSLIVM